MPATGIVGQNVIAPVVPFSTADVHPSHLALYGKGGLRTVADVTERDAIPAARRESGMLVYVTSLAAYQQLGSDLTTWSSFSSGGGGGATGPTGPSGSAGAASTVTGPTGSAGSASTVTGPTGATGAGGAASIVTGPTGSTGAQSIVTGPTGATGAGGSAGAASTVSGPTGSTGPTGATSAYSLPTASDSVLGGIKIGSGLSIDGSGVVTAAGGSTDASTLTSGTLPDARLSNSIVSAMGMSASVVDVVPRLHCANTYQGLTSGIIFWTFFTPQKTITVDRIAMCTGSTAASGLTLARMGLYTFDETTATLVARTASDTALFNSTAAVFTKIFDTAGSFPANYTLQAGTRYGVAVICTGSIMPSMVCDVMNNAIAAITPRVYGYRTGQTDLLSTNTSFSVASSNPLWARLS